jgi:hypothetical protein
MSRLQDARPESQPECAFHGLLRGKDQRNSCKRSFCQDDAFLTLIAPIKPSVTAAVKLAVAEKHIALP